MRRHVKKVMCVVALVAASIVAYGGKENRNAEQFYFLDSGKMSTQASDMEQVIIAFDPENEEFVWKDFAQNGTEYIAIEETELDPLLRDLKSAEDIKIIDQHEGTYYKMRKLTENGKMIVGLDLGLRLNGGGPALAVLCGVACKIVATFGCGFGGMIVGTANPIAGIVYAGLCGVLADVGSTVSCMTVCLGLPTP